MTDIEEEDIGDWELTFISKDGKHSFSYKGYGWENYQKMLEIQEDVA